MKFILGYSLLLVPLFWPIITGIMAKTYGRPFWKWFFIAIPLPLIAALVLLFLPDQSKKKTQVNPLENDEVFNYLFDREQEKQIVNHESHFSATA